MAGAKHAKLSQDEVSRDLMSLRELRRILSTLKVWAFCADMVALAVVACAASYGYSVSTAILAGVALVLSVLVHKPSEPSAYARTALAGLLADGLITRYLVLAASWLIGIASGGLVFWIFSILLAANIAAELVVKELRYNSMPYVWNLPGIPNRHDTRLDHGYLYLLNTAAVFVGIFAAADVTALVAIFGVIVGASAIAAAIAAIDSVTGNMTRKREERLLPQKLAELAPTFAFYFNAPPNAVFHMGMWLPYLERVGDPFIIIVRNRRNFNEARAVTDRPVIYRRAREDLDAVITPSLTTVFYGNLAGKNEHMVWYDHLTHVQMNHGESDKKSSFNPAYRMYDIAFVAGQAGIDRFHENGVRMFEDAFRIVGRPQVENVERVAADLNDDSPKTVLYAPTWGGFHGDVSHCSLPVGHDVVGELLKHGCTVIFRPHPFSYRSRGFTRDIERIQDMLREDSRRHGRQHVFGKPAETDMTIYECFNASNAMVSDVSSVIGDYLFSEKPFAIVAVAASGEEFEESFPVSRAGYVIDASTGHAEGLTEAVERLLVIDPLQDRRRELRSYYLGDIAAEGYAQRFVNVARSVIHSSPADVTVREHEDV